MCFLVRLKVDFYHTSKVWYVTLSKKEVFFIILNHPDEDGCGIESNYNKVSIFNKGGEQFNIKKDRKDRVAKQILEFIVSKQA